MKTKTLLVIITLIAGVFAWREYQKFLTVQRQVEARQVFGKELQDRFLEPCQGSLEEPSNNLEMVNCYVRIGVGETVFDLSKLDVWYPVGENNNSFDWATSIQCSNLTNLMIDHFCKATPQVNANVTSFLMVRRPASSPFRCVEHARTEQQNICGVKQIAAANVAPQNAEPSPTLASCSVFMQPSYDGVEGPFYRGAWNYVVDRSFAMKIKSKKDQEAARSECELRLQELLRGEKPWQHGIVRDCKERQSGNGAPRVDYTFQVFWSDGTVELQSRKAFTTDFKKNCAVIDAPPLYFDEIAGL